MANVGAVNLPELVALRKESVDRNCRGGGGTRAAWVALRKESVDRNFLWGRMDLEITRRSPQGERG